MSKLYNKVFKKQQDFVTTLKHNTCKPSHLYLLMKNVLVWCVCVLGDGVWIFYFIYLFIYFLYFLAPASIARIIFNEVCFQIIVLHVLGVSIYRIVSAKQSYGIYYNFSLFCFGNSLNNVFFFTCKTYNVAENILEFTQLFMSLSFLCII